MERESRIAQWLRRRATRAEAARGGDGSPASPAQSADGRAPRSRRWSPRGGRAAAGAGEAAEERADLLLTAAEAGFPLAPAAHPSGYGCSCVRIGCPTPGRHPVSFAWQTQATTDRAQIERWLRAEPQANFVTATGRAHDVLDVPAEAGYAALARLEERERDAAADGAPGGEAHSGDPAGAGSGPEGDTGSGAAAEPVLGPVALLGEDRMLFFTRTRGRPEDEDEWWPCELDSHPETMEEHPGLRWHCRGSYVLLPPSRLPDQDEGVRWLRPPAAGAQLPEPLTLLETLTDACAEYAITVDGLEERAPWPAR
ncbi:bifunctional DNA primase/polymerase [Streptomyces tubbatahanensis]|uniref:Bifunctional DNA primase/polymerase n=1 Tax=Streptomyces tubbatahanensis TaxID=2923272 RepID=A0ABY3XQL7_9ACTN|nr:bifunctional DNA primase/polymerase [Streptomyces tubbatahanensis]UNS96761.1 bifunctional DNA primase/polymerase [Streptomyces tubbatahanensis]